MNEPSNDLEFVLRDYVEDDEQTSPGTPMALARDALARELAALDNGWDYDTTG